jgi:hypothetical protein
MPRKRAIADLDDDGLVVGAKVDPETLGALRAIAKREDRTQASLVRRFIREGVEREREKALDVAS